MAETPQRPPADAAGVAEITEQEIDTDGTPWGTTPDGWPVEPPGAPESEDHTAEALAIVDRIAIDIVRLGVRLELLRDSLVTPSERS